MKIQKSSQDYLESMLMMQQATHILTAQKVLIMP